MRFSFHRRDWIVLAACAGLLAVLAVLIDPRRPPTFDEAVLHWLGEQLRGPVGDGLLMVYRLSGKHFTSFLVLASLIFVLMRHCW